MRTINGHFTVINEPGTARKLAANLLQSFESVRSPEHIIITEENIILAVQRAQGVKIASLDQSIAKLENEIESIPVITDKVTHSNVDKAQKGVLDATNSAEKASSNKNWRKLDRAKRKLAKELAKSGFESYTQYVDFLNSQGLGDAKRRRLLVKLEDLKAQQIGEHSAIRDLKKVTPLQVITTIADVLARCAKTQVGPLPIVVDDALRNLDVTTKLRALDLLKSHSAVYATWYVSSDPVVLSWAGFTQAALDSNMSSEKVVFDIDSELAS